MFKTVNFNIYEENLEKVVYGESVKQEKNRQNIDPTDQPIPKPPPSFLSYPLSYKSFDQKSDRKEIL